MKTCKGKELGKKEWENGKGWGVVRSLTSTKGYYMESKELHRIRVSWIGIKNLYAW